MPVLDWSFEMLGASKMALARCMCSVPGCCWRSVDQKKNQEENKYEYEYSDAAAGHHICYFFSRVSQADHR